MCNLQGRSVRLNPTYNMHNVALSREEPTWEPVAGWGDAVVGDRG